MAEKKEGGPKGVARWDPFGELEAWEPLRDWPFREFGGSSRLARMMEEMFGRPARRGQLVPAIDVSEDDGNYVVSVELPGVRKDDVTVECQDGVLTIRGEKKSEREEKKEKSRYLERSYGAFSRSFTLPSNADPDRIQAGFKDGVLTVTIAKTEETKPRVISIKA
jgi:HSP20 family protein